LKNVNINKWIYLEDFKVSDDKPAYWKLADELMKTLLSSFEKDEDEIQRETAELKAYSDWLKAVNADKWN